MFRTQPKDGKRSSLYRLNAGRQTLLSVLLMAAIPTLAAYYLGYSTRSGSIGISFSFAVIIGVIVILAISGYWIVKKYADNIVKLREYISGLVSVDDGNGLNMAVADKISLLKTSESEDLKFIERSFNAIIQELIQLEHQRTMIESLSILCRRIQKPVEELEQHLDVLYGHVNSDFDAKLIQQCLDDAQFISKAIHSIYNSREFKHHNVEATGTRLTQREFAELAGLIVNCPYHDLFSEACPLDNVRKMPLKDRLDALHKMSRDEAVAILEYHGNCSCKLEASLKS